jgi:hypothetical protein
MIIPTYEEIVKVIPCHRSEILWPEYKITNLDGRIYFVEMTIEKAKRFFTHSITSEAKNELTKFILERV